MFGELKNVLTKHRSQESVLSACRDRDDEWRVSVLDRVEFMRDCRAENCRYNNGFFFNFCNRKRKPKRLFSPKKVQKAGIPGDQMRDRAVCELVDEILNKV